MNRNLIMQHPENFPVKITHTKQGSFGFTLNSNSVESVFFTCHIDWGDGTPLEYKSFDTTGTASHTYADVGTKTIIIKGLNPKKVSVFNVTTTGDVVTDIDIRCLVDITQMRYQYCKNADLFANGIPNGLFDNHKKLNIINNMFNGFNTSNINKIPNFLLANLPKIQNASYLFKGCSYITELPVDLFRYNPILSSVFFMFQDCIRLTTIPLELFKYNPDITGLSFTFYGCTGLTAIPADLLTYSTQSILFEYTLCGCSNLSGEVNLPESRLATSVNMVAANTKITKINFPENFAADVSATGVSMDGWINNCTQYNSPVSINFKLKSFSITATTNVPVPSIRLLNQNSTFTGVTPQVNITGCKTMSVEAYNQLLTDLPSGLTGKTVKLPTICQTNSTDATIATSKGWSVIYG